MGPRTVFSLACGSVTLAARQDAADLVIEVVISVASIRNSAVFCNATMGVLSLIVGMKECSQACVGGTCLVARKAEMEAATSSAVPLAIAGVAVGWR